MTHTILDTLAAKLNTEFDRSGRAHAICPNCGADSRNRTGHKAYHFYLYDLPSGARGAICQSCGYKPKLAELAERLNVANYIAPPRRAPVAAPVAPWEASSALESYRAYQRSRWASVVAEWQRYKPVTERTIYDNDLGYGRLPFYSDQRRAWYPYRYDRLIVPIMRNGAIIGLRGRAVSSDDNGPKWLTASCSQSHLMGLDRIEQGATVAWCENLVDRLLAAQSHPSVVYIASGGVSWTSEWLESLAARKPSKVIVWFDNDMAGCPNLSVQRNATRTDIEPRGFALANELLARGINASVYRWQPSAPEHADLGWLLSKGSE